MLAIFFLLGKLKGEGRVDILKLKSINRINNLIDQGYIKRIYIADAWGMGRAFMRRISELFGDKVDVYEIKHCMSGVRGIDFTKSDAVLFFEDVIRTYSEVDSYIVRKAKEGKAFIKVLSEDIFEDYEVKDRNFRHVEVYSVPKDTRIHSNCESDEMVKKTAERVAESILNKDADNYEM